RANQARWTGIGRPCAPRSVVSTEIGGPGAPESFRRSEIGRGKYLALPCGDRSRAIKVDSGALGSPIFRFPGLPGALCRPGSGARGEFMSFVGTGDGAVRAPRLGSADRDRSRGLPRSLRETVDGGWEAP